MKITREWNELFKSSLHRAITLFAVISTALAILVLGATPAQANPVSFTLNKTINTVLQSEPVSLSQDTPCPAGVHAVRAVLVDADSTSTSFWFNNTNAAGEWTTSWITIPSDAALGDAQLHVDCFDGATLDMTTDSITVNIVDQDYNIWAQKTHILGTAYFSDSGSEPACAPNATGELYVDGPTHNTTGTLYGRIDTVPFTAYSWSGGFYVPVYLDPDKYLVGQSYFVTYECTDGTTTNSDWVGYRFVAQSPEYVALGDSYSSGEGAFNYDISGIGPSCHDSSDSYPYNVASTKLLGTPDLVACSGSVTDDLWNDSPTLPTSESQFSHLTEDTQVVTLTIGGNDIGFANIMRECADYGLHVGYGCASDSVMLNRLSEEMGALADSNHTLVYADGTDDDISPRPIHAISDVIAEIAARSPQALIVIGGYPHLFGSSVTHYTSDPISAAPPFNASGYVCDVSETSPYTVRVDYNDAQWINSQVDALNAIIQNAVQDAQNNNIYVRYADTWFFDTHGLCDSSGSWFNGVYLDSGLSPMQESFHPTPEGMVWGYGRNFNAAFPSGD